MAKVKGIVSDIFCGTSQQDSMTRSITFHEHGDLWIWASTLCPDQFDIRMNQETSQPCWILQIVMCLPSAEAALLRHSNGM